MKVYLVRHGQTYTNALACHSGWADIPLTAQGERDALEAGELLKGIRFDRVYTSDLRRAVQTEKIVVSLVPYSRETSLVWRQVPP